MAWTDLEGPFEERLLFGVVTKISKEEQIGRTAAIATKGAFV